MAHPEGRVIWVQGNDKVGTSSYLTLAKIGRQENSFVGLS